MMILLVTCDTGKKTITSIGEKIITSSPLIDHPTEVSVAFAILNAE